MKYLGFLGIFLSLGILLSIISYGGGFYSLINSFNGANISYLSFAIFLYFIMLMGFALRWMRFSLASGISASFRVFFKFQLIGHWISTITPLFMSGGEFAKAYLLSKHIRVKKSKTIATLVHPWFFDLASFLIMDIFVFIFLVFFIKRTLFGQILMFAIFIGVIITGFLFYAVFNERRAYKIADKFLRIFSYFDFLKSRISDSRIKLKDDVHLFSETIKNTLSFRGVIIDTTITIFLRLFEVIRVYFIILAFGETISFSMIFIAITLARISVFAPGLPGGIGAVEAGLVSGFLLGGMALPIAVSIAITDRLITFGSLGIFGMLSLRSLKITAREATKF